MQMASILGPRKLVVGLLDCLVLNASETTQVPRHPQGLYVIVGPNEVKDLDSLAKNPAVSGFALGLSWSAVNLNPPTSSQLPLPLDCGNLPTYKSSDP